jgi:hypothetical protein
VIFHPVSLEFQGKFPAHSEHCQEVDDDAHPGNRAVVTDQRLEATDQNLPLTEIQLRSV